MEFIILRSRIFIVIIMIITINPSFAENYNSECHKQQEISEWRLCVENKKREGDDILNSVYRKLILKISPRGRAELNASQKIWSQYQKAHCKFHLLGMKDSGMYSTFLAQCYMYKTQERIKELRYHLECNEGMMPCRGQ